MSELLEASKHALANSDTYPGYPTKRLVIEDIDELTNMTLPDGEWSTGSFAHPTLNEQQELKNAGYKLDDYGRPLHPWLRDMATDPNIGVVTGKGAYWHWGPNRAADPIVVTADEVPKVLLIQRRDTGAWALPGGFIDGGEAAVSAAKRELFEEAGLLLIGDGGREIYNGVVADTRTTAHSWAETTALLWKIDEEQPVVAGDDAKDAKWCAADNLPEALHGSHAVLIRKALAKAALLDITAHAISAPAERLSYILVTGGHMSYYRVIAKTKVGDVFMKCHDKHSFSDPIREAHSRQYLHKEKHVYDHVEQHGFLHIPASVHLTHDHALHMEALTEHEGWRWRAPVDSLDQYISQAFESFDRLEQIPLMDDFHDTDGASHDLLFDMGWCRYDLDIKRQIAARLDRWHPQFHEHFRKTAVLLERDIDMLHDTATPTMPEVFAHHDLRQANVAWHPEHGVKIVDWSWAGIGPKNCDATMLLIDLHKSGHDVSNYMERFNKHHAHNLIGYWLAQCQLEPRMPYSKVRFQQALSAISAYDLLLKHG